ncbi:IclR family transcriptional regulator [Ramlibacter sp. AW1]|uniref:IclR family transcriptional regulator n=1 Tax=Ramlibacter aurantiacus TaxID=2801330 RepID=A0A936ZSJ9_9BURK|nr:IclR family transcriptional regulator [Ramlibacter aurantiacus]MBL0422911.1 IclR family transcriptional regulator [Ramlibacter aurantiacus]
MASGLTKAVSVLDAFSDGSPVLSAEQICARGGYATATGYRYIRDMCEAGLLVRLPQGYAPGPRIIEWDYMIRANDPLLRNSHDLVSRLVADTGLELLLSQLYGDRIVNVYYEHSASNEPLELGRGRVMPLFRGSTSRVILAEMPQRQLRRLYEAHKDDADLQAIGDSWKSFSRALDEVREQGHVVSTGQLHPDKTGISAPVFGVQNHILGSLTLIGSTSRFGALREDYVVACVKDAAQEITRRIAG